MILASEYFSLSLVAEYKIPTLRQAGEWQNLYSNTVFGYLASEYKLRIFTKKIF